MSVVGKRRENRQNDSYIPFDYKTLKLRIRAFCGEARFAAMVGINTGRLARVLDEGGEFTQGEILRAAELLGLGGPEVTELFFTKRVKEKQQKQNISDEE